MDIRISGSGAVTPGEYNAVTVSGSCKIEGPVQCEKLLCSGSVHAQGDITCTGDARVSGSMHTDGLLEAQTAEISGSFHGSDLRTQGAARLSGAATLSGGISGGEVRISGSTKLGGDLEGETVRIAGVLRTPGLVNGETVEISPSGSEIGAVGGSKITVKRTDTVVHPGFFARLLRWLFGYKERKNETLTVRDGIEGDEIELEYTVCPRVTGKRVVIGPGCSIGEVCYTEECTVDPEAEVGACSKA